jgi:translation initiation factor 1
MGKKRKQKLPVQEPGDSGTSLGSMLGALGFEASGGSAAAPPPAGPSDARKVVVRKERKGRGGKTVTTVRGLGEPKARAKALGKALGVGARVEGDDVVVQGEQIDRVVAWLEQAGVRGIVRG